MHKILLAIDNYHEISCRIMDVVDETNCRTNNRKINTISTHTHTGRTRIAAGIARAHAIQVSQLLSPVNSGPKSLNDFSANGAQPNRSEPNRTKPKNLQIYFSFVSLKQKREYARNIYINVIWL